MRGPELWDTEDHISDEAVADSATNVVPPGSVLLVTRSGILRHTLPIALAKVSVAINQDIKALQPGPLTTGYFAAQLLRWHEKKLLERCAKVGTTVESIDFSALLAFKVCLPPLAEQERISSILSSVDEAIESTQVVIDQLQVVKKAMMGELLTKGIPGRHSRFKKTQIGEVPEGWGVVPLGDAGEWLSGGTPSKQNGAFWTGPIPWVSPKDMKRSRIDDAIDHVSEAALGNGTRLAPVGSILMVVRGMILAHSFPVALTIAPVAFNQDVKALVPSREFEADYLLYCLQCRAQEVVAMADVSNHGTKRLATEKLFALAIPRPERDEQKEIAATIRSVEVREERERAYVEQLRTLKSALLSVLLTGEVRVRGGAPIPGPSPVAGEGRAEG